MFDFLKNLFKSNKQVKEYKGEIKVDQKTSDDTEQETVLVATRDSEIAVPKSSKFTVNSIPANKGKVCINNGVSKRFINKDDPIPEGWTLGGLKKK